MATWLQEVYGASQHPGCALPRIRLPTGPAGGAGGNQREDDRET